ncbi:MAG: hypothetical protein II789_09120 [Clostridia bacterium]|nr:hypothetical protein [Clostridia bacterium]
MKINDLYDAVAGIDDDLIERADAARRGGNASAVRTASAHNTINTGRLTGIAASVIAAVCVMAVIISVAGPVAGGKGGHGYGFSYVQDPESTGRVYRNSNERLIVSETPANQSKPTVFGYWIIMSTPLCVENGGEFQIDCALGDAESKTVYQYTDEELARRELARWKIKYRWLIECKTHKYDWMYGSEPSDMMTFFGEKGLYSEDISFSRMKSEFIFDDSAYAYYDENYQLHTADDPALLPFHVSVPVNVQHIGRGVKGMVAVGFGHESKHDSMSRGAGVYFYSNGEYVGFGSTQEEACLNSYLLSDPDRAEDRGPVEFTVDDIMKLIDECDDRIIIAAGYGEWGLKIDCYHDYVNYEGLMHYVLGAHGFAERKMFLQELNEYFPDGVISVLTINLISPREYLELIAQ